MSSETATDPEAKIPARGPYAKTAGIRQAIAAAALDLVIERGHVDITTSEIAARAGMGKTAALYHLPTRDHMLIAAFIEHEERTHESESSTELEDFPEQAARGVQRDRIARLYQALLAESHRPDHPAHEYFQQHFRLGVSQYAAEIQRRQEQGLVAADVNPEMAARIIFAAWDGLQIQWLNDPAFDMADAMREVLSSVLYRRTAGSQ